MAQQYPFVPVTDPQAPRNVKVIFQDSRGRLWLGTDNDLVSFDGAHFYSLREMGFNISMSQGIAEDDQGGIWDATETGIIRYAHGRVEEIIKGTGVSVFSIAPGVMLAASAPARNSLTGYYPPDNISLYRMRYEQGKGWKVEQLSNWTPTGYVSMDAQGTALFPCKGGWCELARETILGWHPGVLSSPVLHNFESSAVRIIRDRSNCVWFRGQSGSGFQCPGESQVTQFAESGTLDDYARLIETADGSVVIIGTAKLYFCRPGQYRIIRATNGLPETEYVFRAKDGTLWLGGEKGLFRVPHAFQLEYWTARDGLEAPFSVLRTGPKVFAAAGQGIRVLNEDRQNWQTIESTKRFGLVTQLVPAHQNDFYAVIFAGVAQVGLDGKIIATSPFDDKFGGTKLVQTSDRKLWLSGFGVRQVIPRGGHFEFGEPQEVGNPPDFAFDMDYDSAHDRLWVGDPHGLLLREHGNWRQFTTQDGLLQNPVGSVAVLPNGDVWYGNGQTAFARLRLDSSGKPNIQRYHAGGDVGNTDVHFFDVDQRGWLWRGTQEGVYVADSTQADAGTWIRLDESDGFPSASTNQQSFFADPDGSVWFAADNNIIHFTPPADFVHRFVTPAVFVSGLSWDGGVAKLNEAFDAVPHGAKIAVQIGSLDFERRNSLRLRYRLLPEHPEWKEENSFELNLGKLSWGSHTLEVQGRVGAGLWSNSAIQTISVMKPFLLTWPPLMGFAFAGLAATAGTIHWRKKLQERAKKSFPDLAPWRLAVLLPEVQEMVGTVLDNRYEVGELLARGGFANVMRGYDREQKRPCAIKIFRAEVGKNESMKRRFEQEVSALQQVKHPHVVSIYARGTTSSAVPYLVMEFVEGKSLREILSAGPLAPRRAASLFRQLADALEAIHLKDICHRDVKPENIMIRNAETPREELVLIDFSISIVKEADESLHGLSRAAGTFEYMAPEQAIGYAEPSSDIYSLAKLLIEMLTGERLAKLLPNASIDLPARVRELLTSLPVYLSDSSIELISSALEFDPSRRPRGAVLFAESIVHDLELEPRAV